MNDEFAELDATGQAELIRRRQVTPLELVDSAIARIERLNPLLDAVITPLFEQARTQAVSPDLPDGPFRGVPFLLKDWFCHTAGNPYYEGLPVLCRLGWREQYDSHLAAKFRATGLVFVGKTNVGTYTESKSPEFPSTRNPWDLDRPPAGSSGGSAAAVAARMVPMAHGNDGFGSIRIPASACGLLGLKPSRGRISFGPARIPGLLGHIAEFVLARSVRDVVTTLDAVSGAMPGDLFVAPAPLRPYHEEMVPPAKTLRIGLLTQDVFLEKPVGAECVQAARDACAVLESFGHTIEETYPPALLGPTGLGLALRIVAASGTAATLDAWGERIGRPLQREDVDPDVWARAELGREYSAVQVHASVQRLVAGVCRAPEWWDTGFDLLVTPTVQQPTPRFGDFTDDQVVYTFGLFTMPWSVTGQPAISLPLGWDSRGLPIGVQFVAAYGREDLLINIASLFETVRPWADRRPQLLA